MWIVFLGYNGSNVTAGTCATNFIWSTARSHSAATLLLSPRPVWTNSRTAATLQRAHCFFKISFVFIIAVLSAASHPLQFRSLWHDEPPSPGRILLSLRVIIKGRPQQIVAELQISAEAYCLEINTAACKRSLTRCQRLTSVKYAT